MLKSNLSTYPEPQNPFVYAFLIFFHVLVKTKTLHAQNCFQVKRFPFVNTESLKYNFLCYDVDFKLFKNFPELLGVIWRFTPRWQ